MKIPKFAIALMLFASATATAATIEVGPGDNFVASMEGLHAGDTLILDGGTYTGYNCINLSATGTSSQPVVIMAKTGETPIFNNTSTSCNNLNLTNATYLTIDGLEITGYNRGINIIGGNDIVVSHCHVHDTTDDGIAVLAAAQQDSARVTLLHNEIDHAGAGTGASGGTGVLVYNGVYHVHDALIANNYIHDLNGGNTPQIDYGIEVSTGNYANTVRDNVIRDTAGPAIRIRDTAGNGAPNTVERNLTWNSADSGILLRSDAIVRNNIVLQNGGVVGISANQSPKNLQIVNNTVVVSSVNSGISINAAVGAVLLANNAVYTASGLAIRVSVSTGGNVTVLDNAGQGTVQGISSGFDNTGDLASDFFAASLSGTPPQNLVPRGALLPGGADLGTLAGDDFAGRLRDGQADIGAYRANANGNPGWHLSDGFKIPDQLFVGSFESWP